MDPQKGGGGGGNNKQHILETYKHEYNCKYNYNQMTYCNNYE